MKMMGVPILPFGSGGARQCNLIATHCHIAPTHLQAKCCPAMPWRRRHA